MSISQDEIDRLERDFSLASSAIKKSVGGKPGESNEKRYGIAYQQLVKAGVRPQLRKKYR
jgi:hypothetical protein